MLINFLIAIGGTPLEDHPQLAPMECLKIVAIARFVLPTAELPLAVVAEDTQYAVRRVWLQYRINDEPVRQRLRRDLAALASVCAAQGLSITTTQRGPPGRAMRTVSRRRGLHDR